MPDLLMMARTELAGSAVAPVLSLYLLTLVLLVLVFLLATFLLVRTMRRFRERIWQRAAAPTACEDVWAMHRLPDDFDEVV